MFVAVSVSVNKNLQCVALNKSKKRVHKFVVRENKKFSMATLPMLSFFTFNEGF